MVYGGYNGMVRVTIVSREGLPWYIYIGYRLSWCMGLPCYDGGYPGYGGGQGVYLQYYYTMFKRGGDTN